MKALLTVSFLFLFTVSFGQHTLRFEVRDAKTGEPITHVTALTSGMHGGNTDDSGRITFPNLLNGTTVQFSAVGYNRSTYRVSDKSHSPVYIDLTLEEKESEEVIIVSSGRTESRIENLPTRVEVLGFEEVDEESGVKPGNIASLLGDIAGIQTQQSSAVSGNAEMRIQGLPGNYTQLLRDGMPLFGAFAGNFSILQIPPLDLKQIEIIKGATSTLYGGGAIAGMINLITRKPVAGKPERSLLFNVSTLGEKNVNTWLSGRKGKAGYTFFGGFNDQSAQDVDGDGFTDVAKTRGASLHPVFYFYPNEKQQLSIGYNGYWEERRGGDMLAVQRKADALHPFFIQNESYRHTGDLQWEYRLSPRQRLTFKGTGSIFERRVDANVFGNIPFQARQFSWYSELSYLRSNNKHDLVLGVNLNGQRFRSNRVHLPAESYNTYGFFVQDDWRIDPKLTIESGFRFDYTSTVQAFPLPRLSVLYRISPVWTARVTGGYGYRLPSSFSSDLDERDYPRLISGTRTAERSKGINADVNMHKRLGEVDLSVNQSFFITSVNRVAELQPDGFFLALKNWPEKQPLLTRGLETYVQLRAGELEAYLGYTFTDAVRRYFPQQPLQPLIARDKFAAVVSYEFSSRFRACIEASHIGRQYLEDGSRKPAYFLAAAMVRYDWKAFSFVLNCENLFDYRQSKVESLLAGGSLQSPIFRELWAPIDGRVANLSVRVKW